ncbi:MAG TPA: ferritin family protein [Desulfuromonadaceae bacterium]|jgi:rubrerythrin
MSIDLQEAIKRSIQTEKNAMNFYQLAALSMKDPEARRIFETLAREEREHAGHFYSIYPGNDIPSLEDFLNTPFDNESGWLSPLTRMYENEYNDKMSLELAMEKEQKLEETLLGFAAKFEDAGVRAIYELNAKETHNHYLLIEAQYSRIMGMVDESDMDIFVRE